MDYVLSNYPKHVSAIVTLESDPISDLAGKFGLNPVTYNSLSQKDAGAILGSPDLLFLTWWPRIIPGFLLAIPRIGAVNIHPSFLPFCRGKHYNFWSLVEDVPFGVTLHFADAGIDTGDILFQTLIATSWEDTGGTLYEKAANASFELFRDQYLNVAQGRYTRIPQDLSQGSTHFAKELEPASEITLDRSYQARQLLNLLRARTFDGMPACYFWDHGRKFEVRVSISEANRESD